SALRAQLTAVEIARDRVAPNFVPSTGPGGFEQGIVAGPYLDSEARNGSPAFTVGDLEAEPEDVRALADATLVAALRIALAPARAGQRTRDCHLIGPGAAPGLAVHAPATVVVRSRAPATVGVRRFAAVTADTAGSVTPGQPALLRLPSHRFPGPWYVGVT